VCRSEIQCKVIGFLKNGGEKETDDSKEIYINGKQRIKARNRVEEKYSF